MESVRGGDHLFECECVPICVPYVGELSVPVSREPRTRIISRRGSVIVEFCGAPGVGKSTVAGIAEDCLKERGVRVRAHFASERLAPVRWLGRLRSMGWGALRDDVRDVAWPQLWSLPWASKTAWCRILANGAELVRMYRMESSERELLLVDQGIVQLHWAIGSYLRLAGEKVEFDPGWLSLAYEGGSDLNKAFWVVKVETNVSEHEDGAGSAKDERFTPDEERLAECFSAEAWLGQALAECVTHNGCFVERITNPKVGDPTNRLRPAVQELLDRMSIGS